MIATLSERAKRAGHPRDGRHRRPRRLPAGRRRRADHDHVARHHRHARVRPRGRDRPLRHPARADPRLHRPQGRHVGQHPRRPGHRRQDRGAAAAGVRLPRGGARARRRDHRRQAQAEPRPSTPRTRGSPSSSRRRSATSRSTSTSRPRPRASPTARACARCSASSSCATRCAGSRRRSARPRRRRRPSRPAGDGALTATLRQGVPADISRLRGKELALAVRAPEVPEGELFAEGTPWRFAAHAGGASVLVGDSDGPEAVVAAAGDRPVVVHDAKALRHRARQPRPRHDDRRLPARPGGARLPARRAGRGARDRGRGGRPDRARRAADRRARGLAARAAARARPRVAADGHRAAARARAARDGAGRAASSTPSAWPRSRRA